MRKLALAIVVAFGLSGCASFVDSIGNVISGIANPVSTTTLYQAELVFDASLKTFNELKALCVKRVLPSRCRTYVVQGQGLIRQAYAADIAARNFVKNNPTLDPTNIVQAFVGVVSQFNATVSTLNATKG